MNATTQSAVSFKKACEILDITEAQLTKIVKLGRLVENDAGLFEIETLRAWLRDRAAVNDQVYMEKQAANQIFDSNSIGARGAAHQEAMDHFKTEIRTLEDEKYNVWARKAKNELAAEYAAIEKRRLEALKALGL